MNEEAKRYPIQRMDSGWWVVWSLPIENTTDGEALARGLQTFPDYQEGRAEALRRNAEIKAGKQ